MGEQPESQLTVQDTFDGFNRHDIEYLGSIATDDFYVEDVAAAFAGLHPSPLVGREAFRELWLRKCFVAFPDVKLRLIKNVTEGTFTATEASFEGTHEGEFIGIPGTGRPVAASFLRFAEFPGGNKYKGFTIYWDLATIIRQIGVVPEGFLSEKASIPASHQLEVKTTSKQPLAKSLQDVLDAVNDHDLEHATSIQTDDFVSEDEAAAAAGLHPSPLFGREAYKTFCVSIFMEAFPDVKLTVVRNVIEGNTVATEGIFEGTHKGDFMGIPGTGKRIAVPFGQVSEFKDGKYDKLRLYWDLATIVRQIGVVPEGFFPG